MKSDGLLVSIFRFVMFMFMLIVFLTLSMLIYRSNEEGAFQSQCSQIIARSGGLTQKAYRMCNTLAVKNYSIPTVGGWAPLFWVTTPSHPHDNQVKLYYKHSVNFGKPVRYEIYAQLPIFVTAHAGLNPIPQMGHSMAVRKYSNSAKYLLTTSNNIYSQYTPFGNEVMRGVPKKKMSDMTQSQQDKVHAQQKAIKDKLDVGIRIKYDKGTTYSQVRRSSQTPGNYEPVTNGQGY